MTGPFSLLTALLLAMSTGGCATAVPGTGNDVGAVVEAASGARLIYVGETHDDYGHHVGQLALIEALHARDPDLAIGMEMFEQPLQGLLDRYVSGEIGVDELLRRSAWYDRWRFDFRHYRPILEFARRHRLPVIALNAPRELIAQVSAVGLDGLDARQRRRLPASIVGPGERYLARLREAYAGHEPRGDHGFDRFVDVQLTWDETMAQAIAAYLSAHPRRRLVVLAGSGHLAFGDGIPVRVSRRLAVESRIVLPADGGFDSPQAADLRLATGDETLPPAGMLGVLVEPTERGLRITGFTDNSGARDAGLLEGDLIVAIDGAWLDGFTDLKIALHDHLPGDRVRVRVQRAELPGIAVEVEVELRQDHTLAIDM